jgi:hypothetical protein
MNKSEQINELATALSKFQGEIRTVGFDSSNPFFKSKYASLAALVKIASPVLSKYGLAVSQIMETESAVTTILMHSSGQWISSIISLKPVKDDPQGNGSAITYMRRYSYASILGLVSDEDDDGNAASTKHGNGYITESQLHIIRDNLIALNAPEEKFCHYLGVESLEVLPSSDFQKAMVAIKAKQGNKQ